MTCNITTNCLTAAAISLSTGTMPPKRRRPKAKPQQPRPGRKRTTPARYADETDSESDTTQAPPPPKTSKTLRPGRVQSTSTSSVQPTSDNADILAQLANMQVLMLEQQQTFANSITALQASMQLIANNIANPNNLPNSGPHSGHARCSTPSSTATSSSQYDNTAPHPTEGESISLQNVTTNTPYRPLQAAGTPIGMNVKSTIMEKIWAHQFIDLADLLFPNQASTYSLSLQNPDSGQPSFNLAPKRTKQLTEPEWSRAMDIYVAIYAQKYPNEIGAILTYCQQVKELMALGANWQYFDEKYRSDREFTKCSWLDFRSDLETKALLKALTEKANKHSIFQQPQNNSNQSFRQQHRVPAGYCFAFHQNGTKCQAGNSCSYKHTCRDCGRIHPMFKQCFNDSNYRATNDGGNRANIYDNNSRGDHNARRAHSPPKSSKHNSAK